VRTAQHAILASVLDQLAVAFPAAHELALQAGRELAKIVSSVYAQQLELYKQCGFETPLPGAVRCYGSVIKHCSAVRSAFKAALEPHVLDAGDVVDVLPQLLDSLLRAAKA